MKNSMSMGILDEKKVKREENNEEKKCENL